jgi:DNA-binding SARP family transcriptional activator
VEVRLFGPVVVRRGDELIPITGKRPALLLRALALEPRRAVSVDALVDAAWSELLPENPAKALQTAVVRLRRLVDRDLIATVPGGYALGPAVTTDVERTERVLARILGAPGDAENLAVLTGMLREWSRPPFDDLEDWRTAYAESARLAEHHKAAEDACFVLRLRFSGPTATLGDLEAAVMREPLREPRWLLLAGALRDADRIPDALHALGRARQTFAIELGISPSAVVQAMEDELVLASTSSRMADVALGVEGHRENARLALKDGDAALAAKELALAVDEARAAFRPAATIIDLHVALADVHRRSGASAAAHRALEEAADLARTSGDTARLAEVALAGSGDAWQTTLDATASAIPLLKEALDTLPAGPTRLRARLLARYAVAASHVESQPALELLLADAAEIAAAVDDAPTTATVLIAESAIDQDPFRRDQRHRRFQRLLDLADREHQPQWRSAVLPPLARLTAQEGDIDAALALLADAAAYGDAVGDPVASAAAGSRAVLQASVSGAFPDVIAAIEVTARCFETAMPDPSASAVMRWAQTGVATLVYDRVETPPNRVMPFPRTTMDVLMTAWVAAALGSVGRTDEGIDVLRAIEPERIGELPHDLYRLPVLWALGRAVWELGDRDRAAALYECCLPVADLLVIDGGFYFLGAVTHHAGLGAAVAGRTDVARALLTAASEQHARIGSAWWKHKSDQALATLPT